MIAYPESRPVANPVDSIMSVHRHSGRPRPIKWPRDICKRETQVRAYLDAAVVNVERSVKQESMIHPASLGIMMSLWSCAINVPSQLWYGFTAATPGRALQTAVDEGEPPGSERR